MPQREGTHYFGPGPAPLPTDVLDDAAKALLNYKDLGYGIAEMSHRSADANEVLAETKAALTELLEIPDDYEILFMQGGGSGEFSAVVYYMVNIWVQRQWKYCEENMSGFKEKPEEEKFKTVRDIVKSSLVCDYLVTGSWSLKASQEAAKLMGPEHVRVATDARKHNDGKFGVIPSEDTWELHRPQIAPMGPQSKQPAFTYYCDNETVDGVEFPGLPNALEASNPEDERYVCADMSSNFISRKLPVSKFSIIFAGAQKNVGTTGITILIIRKSLLPPQATQASSELMRYCGLSVGPVVLDYATIAKNNSLYNTLPIFDVWIAGQVMARMAKKHGAKKISGQEAIANEKAKMLYDVLDENPGVYQVVPDKKVRSRMNLCLRVGHGDTAQEEQLLKGAKERNLLGLKGHRSVGGIRISNYNAVSLEAVQKLVDYLQTFAKSSTNGT
ncbi:MAG: Phosphoserine transaminase [Alyxoria varia]|nr:MAG: Phosphoserine transaminase [Alyxoria varia]